MIDFSMGFKTTGQILLRIAGGGSAILLFLLAVIFLLCVVGILFDVITGCLAKCWEKTGYQPKNKLGRIIQENHKRLG